MSQEIIEVPTRSWTIRALMILLLVAAAIWSWFVISWYVGNMLAETMTGVGERDVELAQTAVSLAPSDPLTHWRLANLTQLKSPANINDAIPQYEELRRRGMTFPGTHIGLASSYAAIGDCRQHARPSKADTRRPVAPRSAETRHPWVP